MFSNRHPTQIIEDVDKDLILTIFTRESERQRQLPKLDVAGSIPVSRSTSASLSACT